MEGCVVVLDASEVLLIIGSGKGGAILILRVLHRILIFTIKIFSFQ